MFRCPRMLEPVFRSEVEYLIQLCYFNGHKYNLVQIQLANKYRSDFIKSANFKGSF